MCLQVATLMGALMVVGLHVSFGDPEQFWAPFVRDLAQQMKQRGLPMDLEKDGLVETLARTLWGWVAVLTMLLAMCALFLARWWQSLLAGDGRFAVEFRELRLGLALGTCGSARACGVAAHAAGAGRRHRPPVPGALVIVGLAGVHRMAAAGRLNSGWLWATYAMLMLVAPVAVAVLAAWGFLDNWTALAAPRWHIA